MGDVDGHAWVPLVPHDAVAAGSVVAADPFDVVVWRTADGTACVTEARCPHQWSHLAAEGFVDGDELVCTAHFWRFTTDGVGTKINANGRRDAKADIAAFSVRGRDGMLEALLPIGQGST